PWAAVHHGVCFAFAGTWRPVNTVVEYFDYPGSLFTRATLTGFWNHAGALDFLAYAGGLLFGNRGFLQANLPLLLALPAAVVLLRSRTQDRAAVLACVAWPAATWLLYAALSVNYSGDALGNRWLVPLLAPGYYLIARLLRDRPEWLPD